MKRRGLRLEVDEPSDRQLRNARWLAGHPGATALIGAVVFALIGLAGVASSDVPTWVGGAVGAVLGAVGGWAFSVENRRITPGGVTRVLYVGAVALMIVGAVALRVAT